jgi:hypothetical protein
MELNRLVLGDFGSSYLAILADEFSDVYQNKQLCLILCKDFLSINLIHLYFQIIFHC